MALSQSQTTNVFKLLVSKPPFRPSFHAKRSCSWSLKQIFSINPTEVISPIRERSKRCVLTFSAYLLKMTGSFLSSRLSMACRWAARITSRRPQDCWDESELQCNLLLPLLGSGSHGGSLLSRSGEATPVFSLVILLCRELGREKGRSTRISPGIFRRKALGLLSLTIEIQLSRSVSMFRRHNRRSNRRERHSAEIVSISSPLLIMKVVHLFLLTEEKLSRSESAGCKFCKASSACCCWIWSSSARLRACFACVRVCSKKLLCCADLFFRCSHRPSRVLINAAVHFRGGLASSTLQVFVGLGNSFTYLLDIHQMLFFLTVVLTCILYC